jgi:hypothetical protein
MDTRQIPPEMSPAEYLARKFHEAYEGLAPEFNYETRKKSRVPWDELKGKNKKLMIATAQKLIDDGAVKLLPPEEPVDYSGVTPEMRAQMERTAELINERERELADLKKENI